MKFLNIFKTKADKLDDKYDELDAKYDEVFEKLNNELDESLEALRILTEEVDETDSDESTADETTGDEADDEVDEEADDEADEEDARDKTPIIPGYVSMGNVMDLIVLASEKEDVKVAAYRRRYNFYYYITLVLSIAILIGVLVGSNSDSIINLVSSDDKAHFEKLDVIQSLIDDNYYKEYSKDEAYDFAYGGLVAGLNDRYSNYIPATTWEQMEEKMDGKYLGIGVTIVKNKNGEIKVKAVSKDSPAEKANIKIGDILMKIRGKNVKGMSLEYVSSIMVEDPENSTAIELKRGKKNIKVKVKPDKIEIENCKYHLDIAGDIGFIELVEFDRNIAQDCINAFKELEKQGAKGIVLDVRNNPGGQYDQVIKICDYLLGECVIVYTEDKNGERKYEYSDANMDSIPLVVLVNEHSASASEVLSAALQDNKRAKIVGTKTFGKALVQSVFDLEDGTALKLTTARYFTPLGKSIQDVGVKPDYVIKDGYSKLKKAFSILYSEIKNAG